MGWSRFSPSGFVDNDFNPLMIGPMKTGFVREDPNAADPEALDTDMSTEFVNKRTN